MIEINSTDNKIINTIEDKITDNPNYLDFSNENTKELTHGFHTYPAMMIPQVAREFIETTLEYDKSIRNIYDPFMGSGTTVVEGIYHGLNSYGIDINPLSLLMAKAKTAATDPKTLNELSNNLKSNIDEQSFNHNMGNLIVNNIPDFDRIDFWFKPQVIEKLQLIKNNILEYKNINKDVFYIFMATFSETVRYVSNTRNNEFKLYRMPKKKLDEWDPDVVHHFFRFLERNVEGNNSLYNELYKIEYQSDVVIKKGDSSDISIEDNYFDLLVTSPPYGDSKTTVAYGQFSRLSLQWLDLKIDEDTKLNQLDNIMLGGRVDKTIVEEEQLEHLKSPSLNEIYELIKDQDPKRALEVLQFYIDLDENIKETSRVMKKGSYQYWVVANRTVKLVNIPTDQIIIELFKKYGVYHLHSFYRNIPNKRMPSINSPTNIKGNHSVTMNSEIILMLKKE